MIFMQCHFSSDMIGNKTSINVLLPRRRTLEKLPTLYLLHGYSDDHTVWMRHTSIERYAEMYQIAVIMPDVQRSFYCDIRNQQRGRYWQYVNNELIDLTRRMFPLSDKREDTYVAGLSMGGFGAFKLALNCPETFTAAASLSGALDVELMLERESMDRNELGMYIESIPSVRGSVNDLFAAAKKANALASAVKPRLYHVAARRIFCTRTI